MLDSFLAPFAVALISGIIIALFEYYLNNRKK